MRERFCYGDNKWSNQCLCWEMSNWTVHEGRSLSWWIIFSRLIISFVLLACDSSCAACDVSPYNCTLCKDTLVAVPKVSGGICDYFCPAGSFNNNGYCSGEFSPLIWFSFAFQDATIKTALRAVAPTRVDAPNAKMDHTWKIISEHAQVSGPCCFHLLNDS